MWRGNFLFLLSFFFIIGNLLTGYLFTLFNSSEEHIFCAAATMLTAILLTIIYFRRGCSARICLTLFFIIGGMIRGEGEILGGYHFIEKITCSPFFATNRGQFLQFLDLIIPSSDPKANGILKALVTGDKGGIPAELKDAFRFSGTMHLLALSGLHVGVIYGIFRRMKIKGPIVILLMIFYALFTGASPSICRAVLMASVYEIGEMVRREKNGLNALAISSLIITLINPSAPSTISFQLSYSAMLGILIAYPHLKSADQLLPSIPFITKIWDLTSISVACQLFTAPLTIFYFGTFPLMSLVSNIMTTPLTSLIMSIAPFSIMLYKIPFAGDFLTSLLLSLIEILNTIVEIISISL